MSTLEMTRPTPVTAAETPFAPFARTVTALSLTALVATSQLYGVIPLVGAMGHEWHVKPASLTWLVTVYGLGYALGFLLFGPLSDRYGRRRLIVSGVAATVLTSLLVAMAPSPSAAIVLRALQGLTIGAFPPAAFAYVGERIRPDRRLLTLTAMTTGFLSSAVVGQVTAQWMVSLAGWRSFFVASAVLLALSALALAKILLPGGQAAGRSPLDAYRAMPKLLVARELRGLYAATPTVLASFVAIYTGLQLTGTHGLLGLRASALPIILVIPVLTPRLARVPAHLRAGTALLLAAVALGLIGLLNPSTLGLAALLMAVTAGVAVAAPGLIDTIGARAGDARGPAVSVFTALLFVGASLGPQLASALAGAGLAPLAYALAGVVAVGAALAFTARRS